jgi:hypothetical protein
MDLSTAVGDVTSSGVISCQEVYIMYTPPLSDFSVISLRRLAWAMGTTMGTVFGRIVRLMPAISIYASVKLI